jgi:glycerophosphoryl diester phosphodiesterase
MPRIPLLPLVLAAAALLSPAAAGAAGPLGPVLTISHRGASGYAPEHTIAAYDLAIAMGADYIEQDLQQTSDGHLVDMHDATLDRTTDCTGNVSDHTLAEIKRCDAGSWFGPQFAGERVPTLDELFTRYGRRVNYYIETKSPEQADAMEERLLETMRRHGLLKRSEDRWQVLVQSFSPASLLKLHQLDARLPLIQLVTGPQPSLVVQAQLPAIETYAIGIGPDFSSVDASLVEAAHARCLAVHPYTVNAVTDMSALLAAGVDGMFTNFPDRLVALTPGQPKPRQAPRAAKDAHDACIGLTG